MISEEMEKDFREYAARNPEEEVCALVFDTSIKTVENTHKDKQNHFRVDDRVWLDNQDAKAFLHSHPNWYEVPSEADMMQQQITNIPWGIVSVKGDHASKIRWFGDQIERAPLEDRYFVHGITDCYSVIRDWYYFEKSVALKDIPRSWEWWLQGKDLYKDNFGPVGFKRVGEDEIRQKGPQIGDVPMIKFNSDKINHAGVYIGGGLFFHHLTSYNPIDKSRKAKPDPVARWLKYIDFWVRYAP